MTHPYFVFLSVWMTLLGIAHLEGTVPNKQNRSQMTFRQCVEKCMAKNYHGPIPSPDCSFSRAATLTQNWDGAPVKVNPSAAVPIYGQMASNDVRRTSRTLSRVIRGIIREKRKDSNSETTNPEEYNNICHTCLAVTCFPFIFHVIG